MSSRAVRRPVFVCGVAATILGSSLLALERRPADQGFTFKSSVELVSVNATVTDASGHFVPGLRAEHFTIFEDGEPQTITQFESERVPVSLGIVLDTSGSMAGKKMDAARAALRRFVYDLLKPGDEMFLYRFDSRPILVEGWTEDRARLMRGLGSVLPAGGTALYDAVADAVPLAGEGSRRKKALVVISDGNDTNSELDVDGLQPLIRESEVMVYAIGIDASASFGLTRPGQRIELPGGLSLPWPSGPSQRRGPRSQSQTGAETGVNERALRMITDDSGGRTEIVAGARNLDQATAGIASELSQQYFLGYVSTRPKDGRWHTLRVQLRNGNHQVRARRGFVAGAS
jgi:Ca-activated chloride channel homolog